MITEFPIALGLEHTSGRRDPGDAR
jgi:hypothetical protein